MFLDVEQKIQYYTKEIINNFIYKGIYPQKETIENMLNDIDKNLAIYKHNEIKEGQNFNTIEYNKELNLIYNDLKILYNLLYIFGIEKINKLKSFIDLNLTQLENMSYQYQQRAKLELNSIFGKTLLYKQGNFNYVSNNAITTIDLGQLELLNGSNIACFINGNNMLSENCRFGIKNNNKTLISNIYNFNQDFINVPGDNEINYVEYNLLKDQKIKSPIIVNAKNFIPNQKYKYNIFSGNNKILINKNNEQKLVNMEEYFNTSLEKNISIDFYVIGGTSITFKYNKKPHITNFKINENYQVNNLDKIHHFHLETSENFMFDFYIPNGFIYAIIENGIIIDDKLYASNIYEQDKLLIAEKLNNNFTKYNAYVELLNNNIDNIECIYIKELTKGSGE